MKTKNQVKNYSDETKLIEVLFKTIHHFWPSFFKSLSSTIGDPRNKNKITYPIENLIMTGLLVCIMKLEAKYKIKYFFNTMACLNNLNHLAGTYSLETIAHPDTIEYLFSRINPEDMKKWRTELIRRLIRMRLFEHQRLLGYYYLIAIDGTGYQTYKKRHCPHCLEKKHKSGKTYYHHDILEAKLVTVSGFCFSIATEFIENESEIYDKQDCELKAFYRLEKTLKKHFPQLPFCLLLDGIYANQYVLDICEHNKWKAIITFKEGSMPDQFREYQALKKLSPQNTDTYESKSIIQNLHWVCDMNHKDHAFNVLECKETVKQTTDTTNFIWITTLDVNRSNAKKIVNKGGRQRWKIENQGFNTQKNGGYNLEHSYIENERGSKNFYVLLQIAHMINQLIEKGSLIGNLKKVFGSIKNIAYLMFESFRNHFFTIDEYKQIISVPIQIRLDSS